MTKRKKVLKLVSTLTAFVLFLVGVPWVKPQVANAVGQNRTSNFSKSYSEGSTKAETMLNIAKAQINKSGSNLGYTEDWCADFVSDCAALAGYGSAVPHNSDCDSLYNAIITAGGDDVKKDEARPGDIVFYDKPGTVYGANHVEIVVSGTGESLLSIGGNTGSDYVSSAIVCSPRNHPWPIIYIARPKGSGTPPPTPWVFKIENAPKCSSTRWIGEGGITSGDDVKWVQKALNITNNAGLEVDGAWGSKSTSATKAFQKKYGLTQDGQAGTNTINKLVELIPPSWAKVTLSKNSFATGEKVTFNFSSDKGTRYTIGIDDANGNRIDTKLLDLGITSYSRTFDKPGNYTCLITAHSEYRLTDSPKISFTIVATGNEMSKGAGQTIADGDYWIESALSKRYLVDIAGDNYDTANGANLKMHIWNSDTFGKYDAFTFKYLNNGFYQITQRTTNMAIDVNGASKERGANVQMWKSSSSAAQQWSITKTSTGYKLQAKCSGYCLDVSGGNIENNTNLIVWEDNSGKGQRFNLIPYKCSHTFGSWSTVQNATCTADGKQTRKCTDCGYTESKTIAKTGHSLGNWTTSKNATCTADGTQVRKCSKCNYSEEKTITKTGHSLGNWTTSKNATCTVDGTQVRKCSKCSYTEEKAIAKTGHKYTDSIVSPSCTEKGYTLHTCSSCNDSYKDKETNAKGHTFTSKMIGGYMTYVCSDCGYMYTAPFEGEGTAESPFIISNADELRAVSETVNNTLLNPIFGWAHYRQTADIDLENISWTPIGLGHNGEDGRGEYNYQTRMFHGVYDGNQHTIYNLNVDKNWKYSGLFGAVRSSGAKVCNLIVYGNISAGENSGGITAETHYYSAIENCAFIGNVKGIANVGGIVGLVYDSGTIRNCYHNGTVTGGEDVGGIAGAVSFNKYNNDEDATLIENCYHVNGEATGETCGAIVGDCVYCDEKNNTITIKNCYASKSSNYGERNETATYDDTMILPDSMLKKIAEDLGEAYTENTNSELNNGFPVFPWQLDIMLKGDADNNGVVDVNDAIMLQEWLLGASKELTNWENVDLCEDGVIDVFDLCLLKSLLN